MLILAEYLTSGVSFEYLLSEFVCDIAALLCFGKNSGRILFLPGWFEPFQTVVETTDGGHLATLLTAAVWLCLIVQMKSWND